MLDLPYAQTVLGNRVQWGKIGQGPAMVALHGTPFSAQVWRKIIPDLATTYTVYYYDLVGYGQSEMREGQDVSLGVQNQVLAELFRYWGLDRPHLLAHDFGGATALRAYYLNGLRYQTVTIFDAVALAPWGSPFVQHVRHHESAFAGMPAYMHEALLHAYLQTAAFHPLTPEALALYSQPWTGAVGQPAFYRQIAQMDQKYTDEVEGLYGQLECPVQLLWGKQDQWVPLEKGQALNALISNADLIELDQCGHLVQEDAPQAIVAAILSTN